MNLLVVLTCFNRKKKTENCIRTIVSNNPSINFKFVIVDDGSTDGTREMLTDLKSEYELEIILLDGGAYYSGGMRKGMEYIYMQEKSMYDYLLMVNDDVEFYKYSIQKLVIQSKHKHDSIIVGVTNDINGNYSYGAIKYYKGIKYKGMGIECSHIECDTFNANCVLIPSNVFKECQGFDKYYVHGLGDFDYGLTLKKRGYKIFPSEEYVGLCNNNSPIGTWTDTNLSRLERIKKKETVKGAPLKQWFYFVRKNFGILLAIRSSITPYIRILLKK